MKVPLLITCALPDELAGFTRKVKGLHKSPTSRGRLLVGQTAEGTELMVLCTGMGKKAACESLREVLLNVQPSLIVISGTAGALHESLLVGDILIAENLGSPLWVERAGQMAREVLAPERVWTKPLITVDTIVATGQEKRDLHGESGAHALDMESVPLAQIAQEAGIDHVVVRVISDGVDDGMPLDFSRFTKNDGFMSMPGLLIYLMLHPWELPALVRFGQKVKRACGNLDRVLEKMSRALP